MIHANELMIGDWVLINGTPRKIQAVDGVDDEIMADDELYTLAEDRCHSEDKVEGIPITPEILEKNGFHYTNEHTLKGADTYILHIEQRGFDYKITIKLNDYYALDSYDDRVYRLAEISTGKWYVHHLQHALELCEVAKEIIL